MRGARAGAGGASALVLVGIAAALLSADPAAAEEPRSAERRAQIAAAFGRWLQQARLADAFAVQKVWWPARPDENGGDWLRIDLKVSARPGEDGPAAALVQRLREHARPGKVGLEEKLFYRLLHLSGLPRGRVAVCLMVDGKPYLVAHDRGEGRVVLREETDRSIVRRIASLDLPPPAAAPGAMVPAGPDGAELAGRLRDFLVEYFTAANRKKGLGQPRFTLKPLEEDFAGLEVVGTRQQVVPDRSYWERLQISMDIKPAARRPDGSRPGRVVVCHLDGQYATGLGSRLPADDAYAEMATRDLEAFTERLLSELQARLPAPRP